MTEEYYIPKIQEFYHGFIYYRKQNNEWNKEVFDGFDFSDITTLLNRTNLGLIVDKCGGPDEFEKLNFENFIKKGQLFSISKNFKWKEIINNKETYDTCIKAKRGENDYYKNMNIDYVMKTWSDFHGYN